MFHSLYGILFFQALILDRFLFGKSQKLTDQESLFCARYVKKISVVQKRVT